MRTLSTMTAISFFLLLTACGGPAASKPDAPAKAAQAKEAPDTIPGHDMQEALSNMPDDEVHKGLSAPAHGGGMGMGMGGSLNTKVHLDEAIRNAWTGVRIRVTDRKTKDTALYDVPMNTPTPLGSSGLTITADVFVPDFVMGADGIATRSPEPKNTAAHVTISEKGKPDYKGWLFGTMPDIHPYPHDAFEVTLQSGIPARK